MNIDPKSSDSEIFREFLRSTFTSHPEVSGDDSDASNFKKKFCAFLIINSKKRNPHDFVLPNKTYCIKAEDSNIVKKFTSNLEAYVQE